MSNTTQREMTLKEWTGRLSKSHLVNRELQALEAENARLKTLLTRMYNKGYKTGHHATVEGQYVDILDEDMDTYHDDIVNEILSE